MASSDSPIDKPQRGRPKRAELPDVNINTGVTPMLHDIEIIRLTLNFLFSYFKYIMRDYGPLLKDAAIKTLLSLYLLGPGQRPGAES